MSPSSPVQPEAIQEVRRADMYAESYRQARTSRHSCRDVFKCSDSSRKGISIYFKLTSGALSSD